MSYFLLLEIKDTNVARSHGKGRALLPTYLEAGEFKKIPTYAKTVTCRAAICFLKNLISGFYTPLSAHEMKLKKKKISGVSKIKLFFELQYNSVLICLYLFLSSGVWRWRAVVKLSRPGPELRLIPGQCSTRLSSRSASSSGVRLDRPPQLRHRYDTGQISI